MGELAVIPKRLTPRIESERLQFKNISVASFQIHCDGVQRRNDQDRVAVRIL